MWSGKRVDDATPAGAAESPRFEHRARRAQVMLAAGVCALLLLAAEGAVLLRVAALLAGLAAGHAVGAEEWRRIRRQIDRRNVAVTYLEDSLYFGVLTMLGLASFSGTLLRLGAVAALPAPVFWAGLIGIAALCAGRAYALNRAIASHERRFGPLRLRTFYARSLVGPEALIGRRATVVERCAPEGRVKVAAELWFARASGSAHIPEGRPVVVRDVEGLCLIVEEPD